jgi:hypothetical protein
VAPAGGEGGGAGGLLDGEAGDDRTKKIVMEGTDEVILTVAHGGERGRRRKIQRFRARKGTARGGGGGGGWNRLKSTSVGLWFGLSSLKMKAQEAQMSFGLRLVWFTMASF